MPTSFGVIDVMGKSRIKVTEKKLGRENALGQYWGDGKIEIDPRQTPKEYLNTLIHEMLHHEFPEFTEERVIQAADFLTEGLWEMKYRKVQQ
jgi:hypothetical protein